MNEGEAETVCLIQTATDARHGGYLHKVKAAGSIRSKARLAEKMKLLEQAMQIEPEHAEAIWAIKEIYQVPFWCSVH